MEINIKEMVSKIRLPKFPDLLDGQKKGEIIFRRVFVLIVGALLLYLFLLVVFGKKEDRIQPVEAQETVLKDGDIVNGQKIDIDENGKVWYIQEAPQSDLTNETKEEVLEDQSDTYKAIESFTGSYRGSRIDDHYLGLLANECSDEALKIVVAISVAESGMGRDLPYRDSNFFGWFKGGNIHYDPTQEQMAKDICTGIEKSYMDLDSNMSTVIRYTGNDRPTTWYNNFMWAMNQMEVQNGK